MVTWGLVRVVDVHFSSTEEHGRGNASGGMWCCTIVSEKEKQFLFPILVFKVRSTERFWYCSHETFRLRIGFWPRRSNFSMVETHVLCELGKRVTLEWWSIVRLDFCRNSMRG